MLRHPALGAAVEGLADDHAGLQLAELISHAVANLGRGAGGEVLGSLGGEGGLPAGVELGARRGRGGMRRHAGGHAHTSETAPSDDAAGAAVPAYPHLLWEVATMPAMPNPSPSCPLCPRPSPTIWNMV